eukprot:2449246-Prymnesium_polylepis.1
MRASNTDANEPAVLMAEAQGVIDTRLLEEIPPSGLGDYLRKHGPAYLIVGHGSKNQCAVQANTYLSQRD